ncbi:unnamed protein product, partial [Coccothraustes coccothraustes]
LPLGGGQRDSTDLSSLVTRDRREWLELCQGRIRLDFRRRFLTRVPREWAQPRGCQSSRSLWKTQHKWDCWGVCAGPGAGIKLSLAAALISLPLCCWVLVLSFIKTGP